MNQKEFLEILKRYRLGNASAEEKSMIDAWYDSMGRDTETPHHTSESELEQRYWNDISAAVKNSHRSGSRSLWSGPGRAKIIKYSLGMAASLAVVFISFFYLKTLDRVKEPTVVITERIEEKLPTWKRITNSGTSAQKFTLADGSSITLEPQSWIRISPDFNSNGRHVYLEGKAFFEVAHNELQPFVVNTDGVVTKVLGTSFTVKAFEKDKDVTVSVLTGKVSVFNNQQGKAIVQNPVVLTPNQQIVYDRKMQILSRSIVDVPVPILEKEVIRQMRFEDAPVKEIFDAIEEAYGIDLVYNQSHFASCTLTTLVSGGDLYNRLDIITQAIGARYEVKEDKIMIIGSGCD